MNDVLAIIVLPHNNQALRPLTNNRCQASIPFGSRYRMIDFILSSMVHSSITNVSILTSTHYRSLMDHLGDGRDWDLDRRQDGLFVIPLATKYEADQGDLAVLHQQLEYLKKSKQQHVLLSFSCLIVNIDFQPILNDHIHSDADITVLYKTKQLDDKTYMDIHIDEKQMTISDENNSKHGLLDLYIIKKSLLIHLVENYANQYSKFTDLLKNTALCGVVQGYQYDGYVTKVTTMKDYYDSSMDLLNNRSTRKMLHAPHEIYTKLKDEPPTVYGENTVVTNSLIANGCIIEGEVENSIVFRGVHVKKGAVVKNSIVMQRCEINENVYIDGIILDKEVILDRNVSLTTTNNSPYVIEKNTHVKVDD
ncbi:glucose-1-phosphate adenylyltransferase subunit GlgD [Radiobacillus sp. PE A8.2]|uniref:glucose-1-phosphate adenylyltransferase subunit GlgD n=1 Tax=Radiobacillus sp. PE A8.2 TaxID=3380349 RepID=UPI00388DD7CE